MKSIGKHYLHVTFLSVLSLSLFSEPDFYGKINVSYENAKKSSVQDTGFENNVSRIGVKGKFKLLEGINISYQIENEIDPTDGKADGDKVFKERNTFIAIEGNFGKLFTGTHDTALKLSQLKVDLFNDTRADIKNLFQGENRMNSFVGYQSPEIFEGVTFTVNTISQTTGSFDSYGLNYSKGSLKVAIASDSNAKGYDNKRFASTFSLDSLDIDVGVLYQTTKKLSTGISENGHVVSVKKNVFEKGSIYYQTSSSDIKLESGEQNSFGYTHKISKVSKVFVHASNLESDTKNVDYVSVGFEYKF